MVRYLSLVVNLSIILFVAATHAEEKRQVYYGLELSTGADTSVEVFVNGVPVSKKTAGASGFQSLAINGEIVPGRNQIDVFIGTSDISPRASVPVKVERVSKNLFTTLKLQEDRVVQSNDRYETEVIDLNTISWRPSEEPLPSGGIVVPQRMQILYDVEKEHVSPFWVNSQRVVLQDVQSQVIDLLQTLRNLLAGGDVERFADFMSIKYHDAVKAYPLGKSVEKLRSEDVSELKHILKISGVRVAPIHPLELKCELFSDSRLIGCYAKDGESPLRAVNDNNSDIFFFPIFFSMIDGKLVVVR